MSFGPRDHLFLKMYQAFQHIILSNFWQHLVLHLLFAITPDFWQHSIVQLFITIFFGYMFDPIYRTFKWSSVRVIKPSGPQQPKRSISQMCWQWLVTLLWLPALVDSISLTLDDDTWSATGYGLVILSVWFQWWLKGIYIAVYTAAESLLSSLGPPLPEPPDKRSIRKLTIHHHPRHHRRHGVYTTIPIQDYLHIPFGHLLAYCFYYFIKVMIERTFESVLTLYKSVFSVSRQEEAISPMANDLQYELSYQAAYAAAPAGRSDTAPYANSKECGKVGPSRYKGVVQFLLRCPFASIALVLPAFFLTCVDTTAFTDSGVIKASFLRHMTTPPHTVTATFALLGIVCYLCTHYSQRLLQLSRYTRPDIIALLRATIMTGCALSTFLSSLKCYRIYFGMFTLLGGCWTVSTILRDDNTGSADDSDLNGWITFRPFYHNIVSYIHP